MMNTHSQRGEKEDDPEQDVSNHVDVAHDDGEAGLQRKERQPSESVINSFCPHVSEVKAALLTLL